MLLVLVQGANVMYAHIAGIPGTNGTGATGVSGRSRCWC